MLVGFFGEGQEYAKFKVFDVTAYDTICFDEVMLYSPKLLKKIDRFIKLHPEKKFCQLAILTNSSRLISVITILIT